MQTKDRFLELMVRAVRESDGQEQIAHDAFKKLVLDQQDPAMVWELFAPVRFMMLNRLFRMAQHDIAHPAPADPGPRDDAPEAGAQYSGASYSREDTGREAPASRPPDDVLPVRPVVPVINAEKTVEVSGYMRRPQSRRGPDSAQAAIMHLGGGKISPWKWTVNSQGVLLSQLTPDAFYKWCSQGPVNEYFGKLVLARVPPSPLPQHTIGLFIDDDEATALWEKALLEVRVVA